MFCGEIAALISVDVESLAGWRVLGQGAGDGREMPRGEGEGGCLREDFLDGTLCGRAGWFLFAPLRNIQSVA